MPFQHGKHVMGLVYFDPVRLGTGCSQYWGFVHVFACTRNSYSRTFSGLAGANQPPPVQAATGPWPPHDLHNGQDHAGQSKPTPCLRKDPAGQPQPIPSNSCVLPPQVAGDSPASEPGHPASLTGCRQPSITGCANTPTLQPCQPVEFGNLGLEADMG